MTDASDIRAADDADEPARNELDGAGRVRNGREQSGYHRAERILREAKPRQNALYSMRTTVGRINAQRRDEYVAYCGGESTLTPTLRECIHGAVKARLLLDWVDAYLMRLGESMVHRRRKTLYPVVLQRQQLADSLLRYVQQMEASLAARGDGGNDIAKSWAAVVKKCRDEDDREDIKAELARRAKVARLSDAALELRVAELDSTLGPLSAHQRIMIEHRANTDAPSSDET